jgi:hypothetical protein
MKNETQKSAEAPRPLILEIEDAKTSIVSSVNSALKRGLPCYIVADILDGVLSQMREGARRELEIARLQTAKKEETE